MDAMNTNIIQSIKINFPLRHINSVTFVKTNVAVKTKRFIILSAVRLVKVEDS